MSCIDIVCNAIYICTRKHLLSALSVYVCIVLVYANSLDAISLVYNLKIRRSFTYKPDPEYNEKFLLIGTALPINYKRISTFTSILSQPIEPVKETRTVTGSLLNLRLVYNRQWWFEGSTGIEQERVHLKKPLHTKNKTFGLDDIIMSFGYNWFFKNKAQFVIYSITGFPSHSQLKNADSIDPLVGSRLFGTGFGSEFSYAITSTERQSCNIIFQNRFLHFFKRSLVPLLPSTVSFVPGNVTDLLFSIQYRYKKILFETGYNTTFFTNEQIDLPTASIHAPHYVRNGYYATIAHMEKNHPITNRPTLIGVGFSYSHSKAYARNIYAWWLNTTMIF